MDNRTARCGHAGPQVPAPGGCRPGTNDQILRARLAKNFTTPGPIARAKSSSMTSVSSIVRQPQIAVSDHPASGPESAGHPRTPPGWSCFASVGRASDGQLENRRIPYSSETSGVCSACTTSPNTMGRTRWAEHDGPTTTHSASANPSSESHACLVHRGGRHATWERKGRASGKNTSTARRPRVWRRLTAKQPACLAPPGCRSGDPDTLSNAGRINVTLASDVHVSPCSPPRPGRPR
jgi:hypothetical protein